MFTKEQLKVIEKYLTAYQTTINEFLEITHGEFATDEDLLDRQELQDIITTVKTKIEDKENE